jgi:hypothetical protein
VVAVEIGIEGATVASTLEIETVVVVKFGKL